MATQRHWQGKTAGGTVGQGGLFFLLRRIPVRCLYPLLYLIIPFCLLFNRKKCKSLNYYYSVVWKEKGWQSILHILQNDLLFAKVVLDKFAVLAGNAKQFDIEIDEQVHSEIEACLDTDNGLIFAGSHIGNFELLGQLVQQGKKKVNCVVFAGESAQYQSRRNIAFGKNNVAMIPVLPDMSHLFAIKDALDKGEIVAVLCDRYEGGRKVKNTDFLGQNAPFPLGTFLMAAQMDIPVYSCFIMKEKRTHYVGYFHRLEADEKESSVSKRADSFLTQYVDSIEQILHRYPHQWFNHYPFWGDESYLVSSEKLRN